MQTAQSSFPVETYPEASRATTALVLGIIGLFCLIVAPFAWMVGRNEVRAIDEHRRPPGGRGIAAAGRILGVVGTCLLVLFILALALLLQART